MAAAPVGSRMMARTYPTLLDTGTCIHVQTGGDASLLLVSAIPTGPPLELDAATISLSGLLEGDVITSRPRPSQCGVYSAPLYNNPQSTEPVLILSLIHI